ncbi:MAG TPA: hypothetical protein VEC17_01025 [Candidatus Binatia bacterium]|nr:hypothetical protein [Candidatus Binatia bacterium]
MKRLVPTLGILAVIIALAVVFLRPNEQDNQPNQNQETNQQEQQLNDLENLEGLDPDTKVFKSDNLGVAFRYDSKPTDTFEVTVTERGNKVYVHGTNEQPEQGKVVEVFSKPEDTLLEQAIKNQFLNNYPEQQCWVVVYENEPGESENIIRAGITYPKTNDPNLPWWTGYDKCPAEYAEINAVRYFLHDTRVPGKYVFLDLGQDSITTDGTPVTEAGGGDWSASLRIYK